MKNNIDVDDDGIWFLECNDEKVLGSENHLSWKDVSDILRPVYNFDSYSNKHMSVSKETVE